MRQSTRHHCHDAPAAAPVYLVDAHGQVQYVLLPAAEYRRVRPLLEPAEVGVPQTYTAQEQVARAAGWADPAMDAYDRYDRHRPAA